VSGRVTGPACATDPFFTSSTSATGTVKCRPCSLAIADGDSILAEETADDILTDATTWEGVGTLVFNASGNYGDNSIFKGEWALGMPHGVGTLVTAQGLYIGEFANGKRTGRGRFLSKYGDESLGEFGDEIAWGHDAGAYAGKLNGRGIERSKVHGLTYEGDFSNGMWHGRGVLARASGDVYAGEFWQGAISGLGMMEFADGGEYVGEWSQDLRHGNGTMSFANGDIYEGEWANDAFSGYGEMLYVDGRVYRGLWADGLQTERGRLIDQRTGDVFEGEMSAGRRHGFGVMHYGNGDSYVGGWLDNMRHGDAVLHYADPDEQGAGYQMLATFMFDVARTRISALDDPDNVTGAALFMPTVLSDPDNVAGTRWGDQA